MHNVWLVAKREYLERVRSKAFILSTILMPVLMACLMFLPALLMMKKSDKPVRLAVVTNDAQLSAAMQKQLSGPARGDGPAASRYEVTISSDLSEANRAALKAKVEDKQLDGVLWAPPSLLQAHKASYIAGAGGDFMVTQSIIGAVNDAYTRTQMAAAGISPEKTEAILESVKVETINVDKGKESSNNVMLSYLLPLCLMMILYMALIIYGVMVMRSVIDEKSTRVVEVLLSSLDAKELMAGKLVGVGAVGLTQMLVWAIAGAAFSAPGVIGAMHMLQGVSLPPELLIGMVVYFLFGYTIYSLLFAAVGAMSNTQEEAQQFTMPVMLPLIASVVLSNAILRESDSALAVGLSLFPLTSPVIMVARMAKSMPPYWQIGLSFALLALSVWGLIWLCARIYRVGILMYGKRPTLPELLKWIKYAD